MSNFRTIMYNLTHVKKNNEFEKAFLDFKMKIELYEKQFTLTNKSYRQEMDLEIAKLTKEYDQEKKTAEEVYNKVFKEADDEYADSYAMHASGLEYIDHEFDENTEKIQVKYNDFMDLYSKSIMVALYSLNESKLNELCEIAAEKFNKKIKPSHLSSRDFLNSSIIYWDLVIGISTDSLTKYISKLKDIQFLRNKIIHSDSKFTDDSIIEIVKKNKGMLHLNPKNGYLQIINSKFIEEFFTLLREFYEDFLWLIDDGQKNEIAENGLKFWFGLMDKNIFITNLNCKKLAHGRRSLIFNVSSRKKGIPKFECKIIIERDKNKSVDIIDQMENKIINDFSESQKKAAGHYLRKVLEVFEMTKNNTSIKIMIY